MKIYCACLFFFPLLCFGFGQVELLGRDANTTNVRRGAPPSRFKLFDSANSCNGTGHALLTMLECSIAADVVGITKRMKPKGSVGSLNGHCYVDRKGRPRYSKNLPGENKKVKSLCLRTSGRDGPQARIINGVEASHGEFPFQISLRFRIYGHICGGTILSKQYVLCAAHCFGQTKNPSSYKVRVGEWYLRNHDGTEVDHEVSEIHVHENYNQWRQFNHDIALLKLANPIDFSGPYVSPVLLPPEGKDYRQMGPNTAVMSGWGLVKRWPQTLANRLQKATGEIWSHRSLLSQYYSLPEHVLGFGDPSKWSACMGDSGGPLIVRGNGGQFDPDPFPYGLKDVVVVGIVSFGPGTCSGQPGVFTEVSRYINWIKRKSGGVLPCQKNKRWVAPGHEGC